MNRQGGRGLRTWTSSTVFRQISVEGELMRQLHPHLEPQLAIGRNVVVGIWVDELGVERLRLYELEENEAPGRQ